MEYKIEDINKMVSDILCGKTDCSLVYDSSMEDMGRYYFKPKKIVLREYVDYVLYHECFHAYADANNSSEEAIFPDKCSMGVSAYHKANRDFDKMTDEGKFNFLLFYFLMREEVLANMYAYYRVGNIGIYYDVYEKALDWAVNNKEYICNEIHKRNISLYPSKIIYNMIIKLLSIVHSFITGEDRDEKDIQYVLSEIPDIQGTFEKENLVG